MGLETLLDAMGVGCAFSGVMQGLGHGLKYLSKRFGGNDDLTKWFNAEGALIGMIAAYMTYRTNPVPSQMMEMIGGVGAINALFGGFGALLGYGAGVILSGDYKGPVVRHYAKLGLLTGVFTYPFAELASELLKTYPA